MISVCSKHDRIKPSWSWSGLFCRQTLNLAKLGLISVQNNPQSTYADTVRSSTYNQHFENSPDFRWTLGKSCILFFCFFVFLIHLYVILLFGTMFEDACELCVIEVSFLVNRCLAEKLIDLLVCETVAHGGQELAKMVLMDKTFRTRRKIRGL